MKRVFTSDWHFNHRNVIPYCNRPWDSVEQMNAAMLMIWNDSIDPDDEVIFAGDLDINGHRSFRDISHLLNGKKHLVSGNHDMTFEFVGKTEKVKRKMQQILDYGWESVQMEMNLTLKNGQNVLITHMPYLDEKNAEYDLRYKELRPIDKGMTLIHGHQHARYIKSGRMIDVGFDGKLGIYTEDDIIKLIEDPREFIPSRITQFYLDSKPRVLTE